MLWPVYSCGLYRYGLYSYGLYRYGRYIGTAYIVMAYSYGLCRYGLYSYGDAILRAGVGAAAQPSASVRQIQPELGVAVAEAITT